VFNPLRKKAANYFSEEEKEQIVAAIKTAEQKTSGEIRLFVESRCKFVNPLDRAAEIFYQLKMEATKEHNGVLVYVAMKDRQLSVFGDKGIHEKVGDAFWKNEVQQMLSHFNAKNYVKGIEQMIIEIGTALHKHFPYDKENDVNELPDDIVFGK
jgi:uncharacterized membrane protein